MQDHTQAAIDRIVAEAPPLTARQFASLHGYLQPQRQAVQMLPRRPEALPRKKRAA